MEEESTEKSEISKLIQLKQYEQPEQEFFNEFLQDFKSRQRTEIVNVSARFLFLERLRTFVKEHSLYQWAGVGAAACALVLLVTLSQKKDVDYHSASQTSSIEEKAQVLLGPSDVIIEEATHEEATASPIMMSEDVGFVLVDLNHHRLSEDVEF